MIAYKQLREIENEINNRRVESGRKSDIPLTNFRGIEIRGSAEIARLALIIAEYQADVEYLGQKEALIEFLPLSSKTGLPAAMPGWIAKLYARQLEPVLTIKQRIFSKRQKSDSK